MPGDERVASAYVRVSHRSQSYATQRDAIARAARARGDEIARWFEEKRSAATMERAALTELRGAARAGELGRLYVFKLDRLSRSGIRDMLAVIDELEQHGCQVVTIADGFDRQGPFADLVAAMLAWHAQFERLTLGERIAAARVRIEASGKKWGRPRAMSAKQLEKAVHLKVNENRSVRAIAVALKIPRATVARALAQKGAYKPTPKNPGLKKVEPGPS